MVEGTATELTVRFGKPFQDESGDYRCEFQFIGDCEHHSGFTQGVDAIDALDNAFWLVGTKLAGLSQSVYEGKLRWAGAQPDKPIGLPVMTGKYPFKDY